MSVHFPHRRRWAACALFDVHIARLRRKPGSAGRRTIVTVRGVGCAYGRRRG